MALTFPPNPNPGDTYTASNGVTYTWDGTKWAGQVTSGGGGGGVANIEIRGNGTTATTSTTVINFVGPAVTTTATGTLVTVTLNVEPLTTATTATLGGVKIGDGISITEDGTISVQEGLSYWTENVTVIDSSQTAVVSLMVNGTQTNIDAALKPQGLGATLNDDSGDKRGENAVDWQRVRGTTDQVASGNFAIVSGGSFNQATALHSIVIGGNKNTSDADYSVVIGGSNAHSRGIKGAVIIPGYATGGAANSQGLIQTGYYVLGAETFNSSPVSMSTDGNPTVAANNQLTLVDYQALYFKGTVLAKEFDVPDPDISVWAIEGVVKRNLGNTTTNYHYEVAAPAPVLISTINNTSNWSVQLDVDNATGCMLVRVQGSVGQQVRWAAKIETIEITDVGM